MLPENTPLEAVFTHDGVNTSTYDLIQDGNVVQTISSPNRKFILSNGLPRGSYVMMVRANGSGVTAISDPTILTVGVFSISKPSVLTFQVILGN